MGLIMGILRDHLCRATSIWVVAAVTSLTFPNIAQAGFFDFLFPPPSSRVMQPYGGDPSFGGYASHRHHQHRLARRKYILADKADRPVPPRGPTDLMDDDSLQHGDAVMTQAGIRIFAGYSGSPHRPEDFRKIFEVKNLSRRERSALVALDTPGGNPGEHSPSDSSIGTGRSAAGYQVTAGETITDTNGRTIRYVGP
jgi:hypothetical protein